MVFPRPNWITAQTVDRAVDWTVYPRSKYWNEYYSKFTTYKPSNGLMAVFVAIDKYQPDEIVALGPDNILDSVKPTQHDWPAELKCIESLVKIQDPRRV